MRFNVLVIGEASLEDRDELIKNLNKMGITRCETGSTMHIEIEDHDLVVNILRKKCGIKLNKFATKKSEEVVAT